MEEFIKENKEFLEGYFKFVEDKEQEIKQLNDEKGELKSKFVAENMLDLKEPWRVIEEKKEMVDSMDKRIAGLNTQRFLNKGQGEGIDETEIETDFKLKIEMESLKQKKEELEKEIADLIKSCENNLKFEKAKERIALIQERKIEIDGELGENREKLQVLIDKKIKDKNKVLNTIIEREQEEITPVNNDILKLKKLIESIGAKDLGYNERLNIIKEETISKLKINLAEKEKELREIREKFEESKKFVGKNIQELSELKKSLINDKELKDKVYTILGIELKKEKNEEEPEEVVEEDKKTIDSKEKIKINNLRINPNNPVLELYNLEQYNMYAQERIRESDLGKTQKPVTVKSAYGIKTEYMSEKLYTKYARINMSLKDKIKLKFIDIKDMIIKRKKSESNLLKAQDTQTGDIEKTDNKKIQKPKESTLTERVKFELLDNASGLIDVSEGGNKKEEKEL